MNTNPVRIAGAGLKALNAAICLAPRGCKQSSQTRQATQENRATEQDFQAWGNRSSFANHVPHGYEITDGQGGRDHVERERSFLYRPAYGVGPGFVEGTGTTIRMKDPAIGYCASLPLAEERATSTWFT
jgi:hypothetical protein